MKLNAHTNGPRSDDFGADGTLTEFLLTDDSPIDDPLTDSNHADDRGSDGSSC